VMLCYDSILPAVGTLKSSESSLASVGLAPFAVRVNELR